MINVAEFIKNSFDAKKLETYLLYDNGGNSIELLRTITLGLKTTLKVVKSPTEIRYKEDCEELFEMIQSRPALVSSFRVDSDFYNSSKITFSGVVDEQSFIGLHAMILIGMRRVNGDYYFLLQNWWEGRYFIEVSAEYLSSSQAILVFINEDVVEIPDKFPKINSDFVETIVDIGENFDEMC
eukprot:gene36740-49533_t